MLLVREEVAAGGLPTQGKHRLRDLLIGESVETMKTAAQGHIGNGLDIPDDDAGWYRSDPDEALASVLAAVESRERVAAGLKADQDVLFVAKLSRAHPVRQRRNRGFPPVHVIPGSRNPGRGRA